MKRIAITGASGLLGWHLRSRLLAAGTATVVIVPRDAWTDVDELSRIVRSCDVVVHLAGMNRGPGSDVERVNVDLAETLVRACRLGDISPHVIFSSSIHAEKDTPYGRGKRAAEGVLTGWAAEQGAPCLILRLPHVFGECGRPFHNSVVSTFCHQLATGEEPRIDHDGALELLHAQDVARLILDAVADCTVGELRPQGREMKVSEALERLRDLHRAYREGFIPRFEERIDLPLFNTLRSYMFPEAYPILVPLRTDDRGSLFELVKTQHGGQAFASTTNPAVTRGEHFHLSKVERFAVLRGQARIRVRRLFDSTVHAFDVDGAEPALVDMPTLHTHNITNVGKSELITLFWSHTPFDPQHPDTYREPVEDTR